MIMKLLRYVVKMASLILLFGICLVQKQAEDNSDTIPAFVHSNIVEEANDAIEAYQTENSIEMEAYISDVRYIDER